jgi:hypothetical protein
VAENWNSAENGASTGTLLAFSGHASVASQERQPVPAAGGAGGCPGDDEQGPGLRRAWA